MQADGNDETQIEDIKNKTIPASTNGTIVHGQKVFRFFRFKTIPTLKQQRIFSYFRLLFKFFCSNVFSGLQDIVLFKSFGHT